MSSNSPTAGQFAGKVALITGAARGQGRSHAVRLASEGADIIALDACERIASTPYPGATEHDLAMTVRAVEALGRHIYAARADVRSFDELDAATTAGVALFGRLDIVCANAGIISYGKGHELSEVAWTELVDINLNGVWRTAKATIPHLITGGRGGVIIMTGSGASLHGVANIAHYVAAKTGVVGLMRSLAIELAPHHIRVNMVSPTNVDSDMIQNEALYRLHLPGVAHPTKEEFAAVAKTVHPMGIPWVEAADVSAAIVFLASDGARYITGMQLPIQGGRDN
jgi:SDR family mycofactocin-dependent oxidoreductase